ncbi:uncharacterized protein PAC_15006 [Phialocephala subalpina]|uniref:Uncharacterized protein n=1 Tax=Phialocephala subalpina TaxID=576137 RepID=A0A1L7XJI9_9HELO|nr:uncharacterized protein PAC_15006 [Phialocephala subalpina]
MACASAPWTISQLQAALAQAHQEIQALKLQIGPSTEDNTTQTLRPLHWKVRTQKQAACSTISFPERFEMRYTNTSPSTLCYPPRKYFTVGDWNVFTVGFSRRDFADSPIFRIDYCEAEEIETMVATAKVKSWRVVISTSKEELRDPLPNESFTSFCRGLCQAESNILRCEIIPKGVKVHRGQHRTVNNIIEYFDPLELLKPLSLVRNTKLQFGNLPIDEAPIRQPQLTQYTLIPYSLSLDNETELVSLIASSSPAPRVFQMFRKLLAYAKAFEANESFRKEMQPRWGEVRAYAAEDGGHSNNGYKSPFKRSPVHPVELGLYHASLASEDNDVESFLVARDEIIEYLDP